jgi:branched-chain amino acid transport system substrate-binding protein
MIWRLAIGVAALLQAVTAASAADLTIGFVTSLSGPGASIGIPYEKGVLAGYAYADKVGAHKIKLIRLDDASDPSAATRNARNKIEDKKVTLKMGTSGLQGQIARG